jgi:hypothetical protein
MIVFQRERAEGYATVNGVDMYWHVLAQRRSGRDPAGRRAGPDPLRRLPGAGTGRSGGVFLA